LLCLKSANPDTDGHCVLLIPKHKTKVPIRCNDTGVALEIPRMLNKCLSQDDLSQELNRASFTALLYKIRSENLDFVKSIGTYLKSRLDQSVASLDHAINSLRVKFNHDGISYDDLLDQLVHSSVSLDNNIP